MHQHTSMNKIIKFVCIPNGKQNCSLGSQNFTNHGKVKNGYNFLNVILKSVF